MPLGVFTGFKWKHDVCPGNGLVALLGYPTRTGRSTDHTYKSYELVYIDMNGKPHMQNQKEVLEALSRHQDEPRWVPPEIDHGEPETLASLSNAISNWITDQSDSEIQMEDGTVKTVMGKKGLDMLNKLKAGSKKVIEEIREEPPVSEKYRKENFDLIAWFIINE